MSINFDVCIIIDLIETLIRAETLKKGMGNIELFVELPKYYLLKAYAIILMKKQSEH